MSDFQASSLPPSPPASSASSASSHADADAVPTLTAEHLRLKMRLAPLSQIEEVLLRRLNPQGARESEATYLTPLTNVPYADRVRRASKEVSVNSASPWKGAFTRLLAQAKQGVEGQGDFDWGDPNDPGVVLHACAEDMVRLWNDPVVRRLLAVKKMRLEEMPGL
jgi:guanine nucleotide-binding protein alpha-1 subunit